MSRPAVNCLVLVDPSRLGSPDYLHPKDKPVQWRRWAFSVAQLVGSALRAPG